MQMTGTQFTNTSAMLGNDLSTLPDFPAEIRAPAGTLPGVSAFQVRIADYDIHTPGDAPDVLVAMNPAALKKEIQELKPNGVVIVNTDEFNDRNFAKANITSNPLEDNSLASFRVFQVPLTTMTRRTLEGSGLDTKSMDRCKNMFALGMCYWLFSRPLDNTDRLPCSSSSRRSRSSPRPTSRCSRRVGTTATSPRSSTRATRCRPAALEPGCTATSPATRPLPWG